MKDDIIELYKKFEDIKKMEWIKSKRKGTTGVGYTFEELINKPEENFPIPDFNSIEIKTMRNSSRKKIHLFSATPDGDFLFPMHRIIDKLGYPDREYPDFKVFRMNFAGKYFQKIGLYKVGKIFVNYNENKVDFVAYKIYNKNLNINVSWSFDLLMKKIETKLRYLAIIEVDSKISDDDEYFYYNSIHFYELINFERFLSLIENGDISICFNIGIHKNKDKENFGKMDDKGTGFCILYKNINKLYNEIDIDNICNEVAK